MNILSLFDGISCARVALDRAGIPIDNYYASEVDKYAIQIAQKNYPDTIHVGSVVGYNHTGDIDLLIGGSPCQDLSIAKKDRQGLEGSKSSLFREYVRILREVKTKRFILENVASMSKEAKETITREMGVEPIMINASLVSAQNRKRLFRTNIPGVTQPEDKGILLKDILQDEVDEKYYMSIEQFKNLGFDSLQRLYFEKAPSLSTMQGGHRQPKILCNLYNQRIMIDKSGTLGTGQGFTNKQGYQVIEGLHKIRKVTPTECERLQCLPDNYTEGVSNSQRYKMLGNGFNVDVVAHILSFIPR